MVTCLFSRLLGLFQNLFLNPGPPAEPHCVSGSELPVRPTGHRSSGSERLHLVSHSSPAHWSTNRRGNKRFITIICITAITNQLPLMHFNCFGKAAALFIILTFCVCLFLQCKCFLKAKKAILNSENSKWWKQHKQHRGTTRWSTQPRMNKVAENEKRQ